MRLAFWILLLVNLVLFFWSQGYLGENDKSREPQRMARQVAPEKLHILTAAGLASLPKTACKRIEGLTDAEIEAVKESVGAAPNWESRIAPLKQAPAHWVVIPELPDRAAAEKKLGELRKLGVNDGQAVEDAEQGPYAISLGVFRNQAAAEQLMQTLSRKGVRSARLAKHDLPPEKSAIDLRAPADLLAAKLPDLMTKLPNAKQTECNAQ